MNIREFFLSLEYNFELKKNSPTFNFNKFFISRLHKFCVTVLEVRSGIIGWPTVNTLEIPRRRPRSRFDTCQINPILDRAGFSDAPHRHVAPLRASDPFLVLLLAFNFQSPPSLPSLARSTVTPNDRSIVDGLRRVHARLIDLSRRDGRGCLSGVHHRYCPQQSSAPGPQGRF